MTVGQRIQHYRKANKLSQEELAGQLFVSRQTISQWEKDQTLPSVDNLIRLKEIFGISIDELLTGEIPTLPEKELPPEEEQVTEAAIPEEPYEAHVFRATEEEVAAYTKEMIRKSLLTYLGMMGFLLVVLVLFCLSPDSADLVGFWYGVIFVFGVGIAVFHYHVKKTLRQNEKTLLNREYHYRIFADRLEMTVRADDGEDSFRVIPYDKITSVNYHKQYYIPIYNGTFSLLRKDELAPDSVLHRVLPQKVNPRTLPLWTRLQKRFMLVFLLLTVVCIPLVALVLGELNLTQSWIFYFFLPIPLASIILGIIFRKKSTDALANIIAGVIVAVILCVLGSFYFLFPEETVDLASVEERVGIDLPEPVKTDIVGRSTYTELGGETQINYSIVDLYLSEEDSAALEASVLTDERWISTLPTTFFDLYMENCSVSTAEYFLIYNVDLQIYNTLPTESGTYRYILLLWDTDTGVLQVAEHTVPYTAK